MARRPNGEGSIYRDSAGRWCVALMLDDGKRKVAHCDSPQEASDRLKQFLAEREAGRLVTGLVKLWSSSRRSGKTRS